MTGMASAFEYVVPEDKRRFFRENGFVVRSQAEVGCMLLCVQHNPDEFIPTPSPTGPGERHLRTGTKAICTNC